MASSAVEATVESCAAEAAALGFTCTWHDRSSGAPAAATGPRAALTLRLAHESAEDAVHVDFLPVLDRVQIFGACGARRARCDVEAGAAGAGRRFAVHILQPLVTGGVADETLLGLPESVRRVIYELLPAPAVGLVAEAAKPLREEASSDAVWMRLLRRDADALLVDPRDLPTADRMRRARDIYAAFVKLRVLRSFGHIARDPTWRYTDEHGRPRLADLRRGNYQDDSGMLTVLPWSGHNQGPDYFPRVEEMRYLHWDFRAAAAGRRRARSAARRSAPAVRSAAPAANPGSRGPTW